MKKDKRVLAIFVLALAGLAFSGYLSVAELSGGTICSVITSIFGVPPCVIGFFMYAIIFLITLSLLRKKGLSSLEIKKSCKFFY